MTVANVRQRIRAVLLKEVIQMRRDRLTFAMIVGIPIIQLVLFGYAINSDPKFLPTGIVVADEGPVARSIVAGMQTSEYFRVEGNYTEASAQEGLADGSLAFVVTIPRDFHSDLVRGRNAQVVLEADATDPSATGPAVGAMPEIVRRSIGASTDGALAARRAAKPGPEVVVHKLYNPEGITSFNIVPGLLGTILKTCSPCPSGRSTS
jgi:ABC-2 type transport system permease protein